MKQLFLLSVLVFMAQLSFSQKDLDAQPGKIKIYNALGSSEVPSYPAVEYNNIETLISCFPMYYSYSVLKGAKITATSNFLASIGIHGIATSNNSYNFMTYDLAGATGIYGEATSTSYAYGIKGKAQGVNTYGRYYGVYGIAAGSDTNAYNYGIYGTTPNIGSNSYAGYFYGKVHVNGTLSKSSGSFKIDHPLDPQNKYLSHSFVESPDMMNVYNGNTKTDQHGRATVQLPQYFEALNVDFRYQLTVIGSFAQAIVLEEIQNNQFVIATDKPHIKVSWQVTGIRNDAYAKKNRIIPEEDKQGKEKGKFLNAEAFGLPATASIHMIQERESEKK
ncbi:hypothetical protein [Emticicia agri]|uniref:Uncharacterized protein n=1 Tax=Emticicia agri TaxID=2492393 RepID=A0A4Q5LVW6_9BACT|nr:hypothetical protein [Emticicia agri]RYU93709.1 hypothetical protein EWM59_20540 [Emticicia agri]